MQKFLVGGAIRDRLLSLPVQDRDWVVVGSTPEEMQKRRIPPLQDNPYLGETRLVHATVVVRHGARTPWAGPSARASPDRGPARSPDASG